MTQQTDQRWLVVDSNRENFEKITSQVFENANLIDQFPAGQNRVVGLLETQTSELYSLNTRKLFEQGWAHGFGVYDDQSQARSIASSMTSSAGSSPSS
jgi:hypothetical protein